MTSEESELENESRPNSVKITDICKSCKLCFVRIWYRDVITVGLARTDRSDVRNGDG